MKLKNSKYTLALPIVLVIFVSSLISSEFDDPESFNNGVSSFATDLYEQVARVETGNVILSPFSAQTILSVALQGAADLTAQQMTAGLQFSGLTKDSIARSYQTALTPLQNNPSLKTANKLYLQEGYSTQAAFNNIISQDFYTSAETVDFTQPVSAAAKINSWVSSETNNLINDLISAGSLNADTRLVLVNAIYFKGMWAKAFNPGSTYADTFHTDSVTRADIPFMHKTDTYNYAELRNLNAKVIELPYVNSTMSMIVILPNEVDGLTCLESNLRTINLQTLSSKLRERKVVLSLPKFSTSFTVTLNDALSNMGMDTMFTNAANFSDMLQQQASQASLKISSVVQKAYIKVDEVGATAAAATGITIRALAIFEPIERPLIFNANRPFIYLLQEADKYPYFIGRFTHL